MTPIELFALVAVFAIVRVAISNPARALVVAGGEAPSRPSTRTVLREYLDAFIVAGLVAPS